MFDFYEVGGAVRDSIIGVDTKDVDFVAVPNSQASFKTAEDAFEALDTQLRCEHFEIFKSDAPFFTIRALVPKNHELRSRTNVADFVLARRDGPSSDGRRPDYVLPGSLLDDLSRRDFTCNAIARSVDGELIDPFNGVEDINKKLIRFVGDPGKRISEDGLRVLRALRFSITKGFEIEDRAWKFIYHHQATILEHFFPAVSEDRIRDELVKMFSADTLKSMDLLSNFRVLRKHIFTQTNLRLLPTSKQF